MLKQILSKLLIKLYIIIVGKEPGVIYRRLYEYTNKTDGFKDECPFCKIDTSLLVHNGKYTRVLRNKYPYPQTQSHLLIIPKRHIRAWGELNEDELKEIQYLLDKYLDSGFVILGRQFGGNPDASVYHLHIHLIR